MDLIPTYRTCGPLLGVLTSPSWSSSTKAATSSRHARSSEGPRVHDRTPRACAAVSLEAHRVAYGITAVPLGGYVRIAGMEPGDEDPCWLTRSPRVLAKGLTAAELASGMRIARERAAELLATLVDYGAVEPGDGDRYVPLVDADHESDPSELLAAVRASTYRGLPTWKRVVVLSTGVLSNLLTAVLIFTVTLSVWGTWRLLPR